MDLRINIKEISTEQAIITLEGNLDASAGAKLISRLEDLIYLHFVHFIVDMATLSSIDSSGLAALTTCLKLARKVGGTLTLAGLSKPVLEIFQLTKLAQSFKIYSDRTSALNSLPIYPADPNYTIHGQNHQARQYGVGVTDKQPAMHLEGALPFSLSTLPNRNQDQRNASKSATVGWQKGSVRWLSMIGVFVVSTLVIIGWWRGARLNASILTLPAISLATTSLPSMETHLIETPPIEIPPNKMPTTLSQHFDAEPITLGQEGQSSDTQRSTVLTQTALPVIVPFTLTIDAAVAADITTVVATTVTLEAQQPSHAPATSMASPTSTPTASPTATATLTPSATNTPGATPKPRRRTQTPKATLTSKVVAPTDNLVNARVELLEPVAKDTLSDKRPFRWQANFSLPPGHAYEVVFWRRGEDPLRHGKGYAGLTVEQKINGSPESFRQRNAPLGEYQWGVLLVIQQPYQRVKYLGGDNVIYVQ